MTGVRTGIKTGLITNRQVANLSLIFYFTMPMVRLIIRDVGLPQYEFLLSLVLTYSLLFIAIAGRTEKIRVLVEFSIIFAVVCSLLSLSLILHPEYNYWFTRATYGVMPYVLRPDNGLYVFLFIRLVDDPHDILKDLRICGWIMYLIYVRQLMNALKIGYWVIESSKGEEVHFSYSLDYGYNVVFFVLIFLYLAIRYKKKTDIIGCAAGIAMVLLGGSRGALVCIGFFLAVYVLIRIMESRNRNFLLLLTVIAILLAIVLYVPLLTLAAGLLSKMGLSSRSLYKLIDGTISDANGRSAIWAAAIRMIKTKPILGYGAMGTRRIIRKYHIVGYPHQLFLELLAEYGVFIGGAVIAVIVGGSIRILRMRDIGEWRYVYLIFLSNAMQLMLSYTYWHKHALWSLLAIAVCIHYYRRQGLERTEAANGPAWIDERKEL